jgi:hypothetical protein
MTGWWAKAPLSERVVLIADSNLLFVALELPRTTFMHGF